MTNERDLSEALVAEAEAEPVATDAWPRVVAAIDAERRRRRHLRLVSGAGATAVAAAAAVTLAFTLTADDRQVVDVRPSDTPVATSRPATTVEATTPDTVPGTTPGATATPTIEPSSTSPDAPAPGTAIGGVTPGSGADAPGGPEPVVAVTADGRVVVLDGATGDEVRELLTVSVDDTDDTVMNSGAVAIDRSGSMVFVSGKSPDGGDVWRIPLEGGTPELVTTGAYPAVSPDGSTLAVLRPNPSGMSSAVVLIDLATGEQRSSTTWSPDDADFFNQGSQLSRLEWSPDGASLLIGANYEGSWVVRFQPTVDATLSDAEQFAFGLVSATWVGADTIEGLWDCCYGAEAGEPISVRRYALGSDEPQSVDERPTVFVDRRLGGERSVERVSDDPADPWAATGTLTVRGPDGAELWTTTVSYLTATA